MVRIIFLAAVIAVLPVQAALAFTDTERQVIVEKVKNGEIAGGAYKIQVKPGYADSLKKRLFVEKINGEYFINRDLDPTWQGCMDKAAATWMVGMVANAVPFGGVADSMIDLTELPKVADCNKDWHETLFKAAVDLRFEALSVDVKAGDQGMMKYVDRMLKTVSTD